MLGLEVKKASPPRSSADRIKKFEKLSFRSMRYIPPKCLFRQALAWALTKSSRRLRWRMGEVYRARDNAPDRTVAVKILPSHLSSESYVAAALRAGSEAISSLNHPHIARS